MNKRKDIKCKDDKITYIQDRVELYSENGNLVTVNKEIDGIDNLIKYFIVIKQIETQLSISIPIYSKETLDVLIKALVSVRKRSPYVSKY